MPAALMIAQTQAMIRSEVNNDIPIAQMLKNINEQISASTSPEKYITLFYGELNPQTGELIYSNAGHNYPVLVRANKQVELLETGGTVIGAIPKLDYDSASVRLGPDDLLFLFTDGLSEAMNDSEEEYSEERIRTLLCDNSNQDPEDLIGSIVKDVRTFDSTSPPRDDTTIIALKMND
jgi:sigma-B regulation protein RsbU (phosphoserine phosphatase)